LNHQNHTKEREKVVSTEIIIAGILIIALSVLLLTGLYDPYSSKNIVLMSALLQQAGSNAFFVEVNRQCSSIFN
jgi:hypothetical protein